MTSSDELWRQILAIFAVFGLLILAVQRLRQPTRAKAVVDKSHSAGWSSRLRLWSEHSWVEQWASASKGGRTRMRRLQKVESLALTAHHIVHIVSLDGRDLLIATSPQGCSMLPVDHTKSDSTTASLEALESPVSPDPDISATHRQRIDLRKRASA
jgi:hypothetical protein